MPTSSASTICRFWSGEAGSFSSLPSQSTSITALCSSSKNYAAKPQAYAMTRFRQATFSGRYQIWSGVVLLAFVVYHLLQFTFLVLIDPSIAPASHPDAMGKPDVFTMVVRSFQEPGISLAYLIALGALMLHLLHGIQSSFQTWGLTSETALPVIETSGTIASIMLFLWYIAIPGVIVLGILKG